MTNASPEAITDFYQCKYILPLLEMHWQNIKKHRLHATIDLIALFLLICRNIVPKLIIDSNKVLLDFNMQSSRNLLFRRIQKIGTITALKWNPIDYRDYLSKIAFTLSVPIDSFLEIGLEKSISQLEIRKNSEPIIAGIYCYGFWKKDHNFPLTQAFQQIGLLPIEERKVYRLMKLIELHMEAEALN